MVARTVRIGGVGAMIDPPCVEVEFLPSDRFAAHGALKNRTQQAVDLLVDRWKLPLMPACEITVRSPRDHTGLGVGTQLSLAIAAGLAGF